MAARIIHIGADTCHRLPVLESVGYKVDHCGSVAQLREALEESEEPEAVLVTESRQIRPEDAVSLLRAHSRAPIVLFRETQRSYAEEGFDLVVPVLHPPEAWLAEIAALIDQTRSYRAFSGQLQNESKVLRQEAREAVSKSRTERERSKQERSSIPPPRGLVRGHDSGEEK